MTDLSGFVLILNSQFSIFNFLEVDCDFFALVEGVGDYGVFREVGAERVGLVFESDVVVAREG